MDKAYLASIKAYQVDPEAAYALHGLARHYSMQGKYEEALETYGKAREIDPNGSIYLLAIGKIYEKTGDTENAMKYYHMYLDESPHGHYADNVKRFLAIQGSLHEDRPEDLIVLLKLKKYEELEAFLETQLAEKTKDENGRSAIAETYSDLSNNSDMEYNMDEWLSYFTDWQQAKPDSHFANAVLGMFYLTYAWEARGSGWSGTVTSKGYDLYHERLTRAREYLETAYAQNPEDSIVPAYLITVAMGLGLERQEMEKQFERSRKADPMEFTGYYLKLNYLKPKWHGSREEMFAFARESAETAPEGSLIPLLVANAHWEMANQEHRGEDYFSQPHVWKEIRTIYAQLCETFPESNERLNWFARTAYLAGEYETAKTLFNEIQDNWSNRVWRDQEHFLGAKNKVYN